LAAPAEGTAFRGFLFADLRGYTAYVERHGNVAGAELLAGYRSLVRAEVQRQHGAEIKTEGDSFYVAFPSARAAVECAIGIAAASERATDEDPAHPIRVGIGVHAGETVETGEGYVGSAVNIAARVAAQARAGEVLVTATVRELVRGNLEASFEPRGRRRLKGVAGDVTLLAVHAGTAQGRRAHAGLLAGAGVALVALVGVLAGASMLLGGQRTGPSPVAQPTPSVGGSTPAAFEDVPEDDDLVPGEYVLTFANIGGAQDFPTLKVYFTVAADGWKRQRVDGLLWNDADARLGFAVVDNLYLDPCDPDRGLREPPVGPSVDDLTRALTDLADWRWAEVREGIYFGFGGTFMELAAPPDTSACPEGQLRFLHTLGSPGYAPTSSGQLNELWILNVAGTRLVIVAQTHPDATPPRVRAELLEIIDSTRIEP
jgi:class 3 adenylate cyclase